MVQEFHLFCEQEHPQRHANTDKNPYCVVYGILKLTIVTDLSFSERIAIANLSYILLPPHERRGGRGLPDYLFLFLFPVQQSTWSSGIGHGLIKYFFGLATGTLSVRNNKNQNTIACPRQKFLSACPLHTNSGRGKERRILIGPW